MLNICSIQNYILNLVKKTGELCDCQVIVGSTPAQCIVGLVAFYTSKMGTQHMDVNGTLWIL